MISNPNVGTIAELTSRQTSLGSASTDETHTALVRLLGRSVMTPYVPGSDTTTVNPPCAPWVLPAVSTTEDINIGTLTEGQLLHFIRESALSAAAPLALPRTLVLLLSKGISQVLFSSPARRRSPSRVSAETVKTLQPSTVDTIAELTVELGRPRSDYLVRRMFLAFNAAFDERFEDGMESVFSRTLVSSIQTYGSAAVSALERVLNSKDVNAEIAAEALRWLAVIEHPDSYKYRLSILLDSLRSSFPSVRDAAGLALAVLDDPSAIPALQEAIAREACDELRQALQAVLDQLEQTAGAVVPKTN